MDYSCIYDDDLGNIIKNKEKIIKITIDCIVPLYQVKMFVKEYFSLNGVDIDLVRVCYGEFEIPNDIFNRIYDIFKCDKYSISLINNYDEVIDRIKKEEVFHDYNFIIEDYLALYDLLERSDICNNDYGVIIE